MSQVHTTLRELVQLQFQGKRISLKPSQPVSSLLSGKYGSRLRGRGLIFEELREYRAGDDIRAMDWKATARLRKPFVRVYLEERERPVLLVVDQRVSMFFGSALSTKATAATQVAALAAWRALDAGNRVGAIVFSDEDISEIRPHRSKRNALRICHALVQANHRLSASTTANREATLNESLARAVNVAKHDHLVVIVTDFADANEETRKLTTELAAHNDVIAALVYDPLGAILEPENEMIATDGVDSLRIPITSSFSNRFQIAFKEHCQSIVEKLRGTRIPILPICTHDDVVEQVSAALGGRR